MHHNLNTVFSPPDKPCSASSMPARAVQVPVVNPIPVCVQTINDGHIYNVKYFPSLQAAFPYVTELLANRFLVLVEVIQ